MPHPYDAILLHSFGGPNGPDDVIPFLENVLRGRNVPRARLAEVAEHYLHFGGVSPINEQNLALIDALRVELDAHGIDLPIHFGNRNWEPFLIDTLRDLQYAGAKRILTLVTSGFSCFSGCRQYREDMQKAQEALGEDAPASDKIRVWYNHPLFIETHQNSIDAAIAAFDTAPEAGKLHIAFCAHSIPDAMADNCAYQAQLQDAAQLIATACGADDTALVWQSRSGPPQQPWLEPDICDHLETLKERGISHVVICPLGFISDHMEVLFDLDHEALEKAEELGLHAQRSATPGVQPTFVAMLRELIQERLDGSLEKRALGERGPNHDVCPPGCCKSGRPEGAGRPTS